MTRPATAPELALFRTPGHRSELFLEIHAPAAVYTARVLTTPTTTDMVTQIPFYLDDDCLDDCLYGGGDLADVLPGMSLLVGITPYGHERGIIRIREAVTASPFEVSEGSSIDIQAGDYLTVLDEFCIWPRHLKLSGDTPLMDSNITYSDQHTNFKPVPVIGADRVVWLTGLTVDVEFDASDSWVPGSTITGYAWEAVGASAVQDMDTATPVITYDIEGTYRVDLTITAANGKTETTHRNVFVFSNSFMPITDFELKSCSGSVSDGGWSFEVEMSGQAGLATVRDRAKVILFARDYYGNTEQNIGYLDGCENIIAWGWIAEESIQWHPEKGRVSFRVQGAQYWLKEITLFPTWIEQKVGTANAWTNMSALTVDKAIHHLMTWRTTFIQCCDFFPSEDTRNASRLESGAGDVWSQIQYIARESILANPLCNRYNQLFISIDPQVAETRSFPVVQTILPQDWMGDIGIERRTVSELSMLALSGISVNESNAAVSYFSLANGHVFKRYGRTDTMERLLLSSQEQANSLAGMVMAARNNEYPPFGIRLASNNRLFDICPPQFATIAIASTDTDRGIEYSGHLIPRNVSFHHDKGTLFTGVTFEAETFEDLNINGDIPGGDEFPSTSPIEGGFKLPKIPDIVPLPIPGGVIAEPPHRVLVHDTQKGFLYTDNFEADNASVIWRQVNWGLQELDYLGVPIYRQMHQMILTPYGDVFVLAGLGSYPETTGIWHAASPTSSYRQILTRQEAADLWNPTPPSDITIPPWAYVRVELMGYAGEKILCNINNGSGFGNGALLLGDADGNWVLTDNMRDYYNAGGLTYGGGNWALTSYGFNKLTSAGVWMQYWALADAQQIHQSRIGSGSSLYLWHHIGGTGGVVEVSGNSGPIGSLIDPGGPVWNLATDVTGGVVMAVIGSGVKKSTDHCSSWGAITFPLSSINIARDVFCADANRWIVVGSSVSAAYNPIVYSGDGGTTWEHKYGNLGSLFPSTAFYFDMVKALE